MSFSETRTTEATGILARIDIKSRFKVGKYGVDVTGFERDVVSVLDVEQTNAELFVIDEIGKMECLSRKFVAAVHDLFASERLVLGTVAQKGGGIVNMGAYGGTAEASKSYFGEPVCETIVAGDINGDCKVDSADFAIMAAHWLEEN